MFTGIHDYTAKDFLRDGTPVIVRAIKASDKKQLQQIMQVVSAESRYFRFFCAKKVLTDSELKYFTELDFDGHIGLIVSLSDESESPIAVGRFIKPRSAEWQQDEAAELALLVGEEYQRQGLGSILLDHLAHIAVTKGVSKFVCYIMPENRKMLNFLRGSKYPVVQTPETSSIYKLSVGLGSQKTA